VKTHDLKCWPSFFDKIEDGTKTFDVRQDDREEKFQIGDQLRLQEWKPDDNGSGKGDYTGRELTVEVTYVMRGRANNPIAEGFCVMAVRKL
jgi:hypothetical protein